jgi:hypothetical protein
VIVYRHVDRRFPFLWEGSGQPAGRWHAAGEGPVQYFADTPDGAWAEFLRHEEISSPEDIATIDRALWAVEIPEAGLASPRISAEHSTGDGASHDACRAEARRLAAGGAPGLIAPSAALKPGSGAGWRVAGGLVRAADRDGRTVVLFGARPELTGWCAAEGRPRADMLGKVRPLTGS